MNKEKKNLLVYGYGMAAILVFIAAKNYIHHQEFNPVNIISSGLSMFFLLITLTYSPLLKAIYKVWMKVAHFIGGIVTTIILSICFYLIFGTIGLVLKLLAKDLLAEGLDKGASSYWISREKKPFNKEVYTKQF